MKVLRKLQKGGTSGYRSSSNNQSFGVMAPEMPGSATVRMSSNPYITQEAVDKAWKYITSGGTFRSSKYEKSHGGKSPTWGRGQYKTVCSSGSWGVLKQLGLSNIENEEVDQDGSKLKNLGFNQIAIVDAKHPTKSGYKPQDGDTAIWKTGDYGIGYPVQHQATYINGYWVSDTIQNVMSVYNGDESKVTVYRYNRRKPQPKGGFAL